MRVRAAILVVALLAVLPLTASPAGAQVYTCLGLRATIVGTPGNDLLIGTSGPDVIVGLGGNDVINGMGGNDVICGNGGDDRLYGGPGSDRIFGGPGNDMIYGQTGADHLQGDAGDDLLNGGPGNDRLLGGIGHDYLDGGDGADRLDGGSGTDFCVDESGPGCSPSRVGTDLRSIAANYCGGSAPIEVNGFIVPRNVHCGTQSVGGGTYWREYNLGRYYRVFSTFVGIADDAQTINDVIRYRVYGDGRLLSSVDVAFGEFGPLNVDVTGVLRLRLEITKVAGSGPQRASAVWAEPIVYSSPHVPTLRFARVTPLPAPRLGTELRDVHRTYGGWGVGVRSINGVIYSNSVSWSGSSIGSDGWSRYNLSRAYSTLTTTLGIDDSSTSSSDTIRYTFLGDGAVIGQYDVRFGEARPVTLDVSGRLRLELQVEKIAGVDRQTSIVVFGEPTLRPRR